MHPRILCTHLTGRQGWRPLHFPRIQSVRTFSGRCKQETPTFSHPLSPEHRRGGCLHPPVFLCATFARAPVGSIHESTALVATCTSRVAKDGNPYEFFVHTVCASKNPPGSYCIKTTVSLRLGHASVLTVHRTVIHCLGAATLPLARRALKGSS